RVERAPKVRTFANVDEAPRSVEHLLAAGPKDQGIRFVFTPSPHDVDERLMGVEDVGVDVRARAADQAILEAALELAEEAEVRPEVQASGQQVALNEFVVVPMSIGGPAPKKRVLFELEAGASRTAERQVVVVAPIVQGDVLQDVEWIGSSAGVLEVAV